MKRATSPTVAAQPRWARRWKPGRSAGFGGRTLVIVDDNTGSPDAGERVGQVGKAGLTVPASSRVGTGVGFAEDQVF